MEMTAGYTSFKVTFKYSKNHGMNIKVYLSNNSGTVPNIKLGTYEEG